MEPQILDDVFQSDPNYKLVEAAVGKRFANFLIDRFAAVFFSMIFVFIMGGMESLDNEDGISTLILYAGFLSYYVILEYAANGKTLGKLVTRTRVVTINGSKPQLMTVIGRTLVRLIPFEPFSFLGGRLNGWHDTLSRTMVIDEKLSVLPLSESDFV